MANDLKFKNWDASLQNLEIAEAWNNFAETIIKSIEKKHTSEQLCSGPRQ